MVQKELGRSAVAPAVAEAPAGRISGVATDWLRDSCGYYALRPGETCRQPRSCYDCLNVPVTSEPNGCFVSPYGACESMESYSSAMNYRHEGASRDSGDIGNPTGGWWNTFPSANSTYCEAQDPACLRCREIAVNASRTNSYMASTSKFCLGAQACVYIVGCEAPTWKNRVQPDCGNVNGTAVAAAASPSPVPTVTASAATHSSTSQWVWYLAIAQLPLLGVLLAIRARWHRCRRRKRKPVGHQLELPGWRAMHDQLAERDRHRPLHAETILHSALPPLAPSALNDAAMRPPLMTRTERNVWGANRSIG